MATLPLDISPAELELANRLNTAAATGDVSIVRQILTGWPFKPPLTSSPTYYTDQLWPFHLALQTSIRKKQVDVLSCVLSFGMKINGSGISDAIDARSQGVFQAFLDNGWDINTPLSGMEPPALAYLVLDEPLARWMLAHGASPNAGATQLARTPIMSAAASAPLSTIRLFFANGAHVADTLHAAAESSTADRLEVMIFLLDECAAPINAVQWRDSSPESHQKFELFGLGTALHYAVRYGFGEKVKFLLERGADAEVKDSTGRTALDVAKAYGRSDMEEILTAWK